MMAKRSVVFGGLSVLVVVGIVASLLFTLAAGSNQGPPGVLSADEAKEMGLAEAQFAGLVGEPTKVVTELTNLEDYFTTSTFGTGELGTGAASVGWHADRKVWVIAFRGDVRMKSPGSRGETYDNITIAIDAETGELIGTDAYPGGYTPPYK